MKLERKKLEILFAILVIFTIGSILTQNQTSRSKEQCSQEIIRNKSNTNPIIDLKNPKTSEFWNVPFIHINGNWSATNISYPWCYGSGKINDPYVIENVSITLTSTSHHGIVIQNSTIDYFVINNCTITGFNKLATDGIVLMDSNNGTIINNNATKCNFGF